MKVLEESQVSEGPSSLRLTGFSVNVPVCVHFAFCKSVHLHALYGLVQFPVLSLNN